MEKRDYYEVLGLDRSADGAAIKSAYRRCAMQHHPDRNPDDAESEERFKEAAEAYEILSDADRRARYDQFGHAGNRPSAPDGFSGMEDILSHFADMFGGGGGGRQQRRGGDLQTQVKLTFMEAVKGCTKEITFDRNIPCAHCGGSGGRPGSKPSACSTCGGRGQVMQSMGFVRIGSTCPSCRGQGRVIKDKCPECRGGGLERKTEKLTLEVPAGVDEGNTMRVSGRGQAAPGATTGNLYVQFSVTPDPRFEREGDDLVTEVPISFAQAALGASVPVPTLDGEEPIELPAGTQSGTVVTLRGKGVQHVEARGRGDLHAHFHVQVPKKLSEAQRQAVRDLAAAFGGPTASDAAAANPENRGFFGRKKRR